MKYGRNINVKNFSSLEEIYDAVNNDPKRPGFQIVYLDYANAWVTQQKWHRYLKQNGFNDDNITMKKPKLNGREYVALIVPATPEQATALKICF